MSCTVIQGDINAIVCYRGIRKVCGCGKTATRLCDWKVGAGQTCDKPLCPGCSSQPAEGKDLCPAHAETWAATLSVRRRARITPESE